MRLAAIGPIWALSSLCASPGARHHIDTRRAAGGWNHQAQQTFSTNSSANSTTAYEHAASTTKTKRFRPSRPRGLTLTS